MEKKRGCRSDLKKRLFLFLSFEIFRISAGQQYSIYQKYKISERRKGIVEVARLNTVSEII